MKTASVKPHREAIRDGSIQPEGLRHGRCAQHLKAVHNLCDRGRRLARLKLALCNHMCLSHTHQTARRPQTFVMNCSKT